MYLHHSLTIPKEVFSYRFDARLDMRMNQEQDLDAEKVVNTYSEQELTRILKEYGEERYAYAIAKAIVKENYPASQNNI